MDDIFVVEAAHHMDDGGGLADIGEELVAEPFSLTGAFDQPGDIDELDCGVDDFFGFDQLGQPVHARVGHGDDRLVGFDRAEGVVGCFCVLCFGQRVERCAFADVGEPNDADS